MTTPLLLNLDDYERLAREHLPQYVYDYYAGGAEDETSVQENRTSWSRVRLRPRMMVDITERDLSTMVLGTPVSMPILTAPAAFNKLAHADGEIGVARATADAGLIQVLSTAATTTIEEVAAAAAHGIRWFQLYVYRDREITKMLVSRAEAAGYKALVLTVDTPIAGRRERDVRNGFGLPAGITMANLDAVGLGKMGPPPDTESGLQRYIAGLWDTSLTWEIIGWLRSITSLPILVKGILTGEDARFAIEHGVDGIIVSNHGGRQLDGAISTCEALPEVVDAVAGQVEVLVDGGIRRGTDVMKALAMGAKAVLIGRPYLWALAVHGEAGVRHLLELLREELSISMALAGRPTIADLDRRLLVMP
jgi:isopentenyl diphosphate isomerase/L-lactate dehydrogenase-like FMN-dependent dehydrogenase